jgi:hypothetical protein
MAEEQSKLMRAFLAYQKASRKVGKNKKKIFIDEEFAKKSSEKEELEGLLKYSCKAKETASLTADIKLLEDSLFWHKKATEMQKEMDKCFKAVKEIILNMHQSIIDSRLKLGSHLTKKIENYQSFQKYKAAYAAYAECPTNSLTKSVITTLEETANAFQQDVITVNKYFEAATSLETTATATAIEKQVGEKIAEINTEYDRIVAILDPNNGNDASGQHDDLRVSLGAAEKLTKLEQLKNSMDSAISKLESSVSEARTLLYSPKEKEEVTQESLEKLIHAQKTLGKALEYVKTTTSELERSLSTFSKEINKYGPEAIEKKEADLRLKIKNEQNLQEVVVALPEADGEAEEVVVALPKADGEAEEVVVALSKVDGEAEEVVVDPVLPEAEEADKPKSSLSSVPQTIGKVLLGLVAVVFLLGIAALLVIGITALVTDTFPTLGGILDVLGGLDTFLFAEAGLGTTLLAYGLYTIVTDRPAAEKLKEGVLQSAALLVPDNDYDHEKARGPVTLNPAAEQAVEQAVEDPKPGL